MSKPTDQQSIQSDESPPRRVDFTGAVIQAERSIPRNPSIEIDKNCEKQSLLKAIIGAERLKSDSRQLGALSMIFGLAVLVFPLAGLAGLIGPDGSTPTAGIGLFAFIGSIFLVMIGILAILNGWVVTVLDGKIRGLTDATMHFIQLAWVPLLTDLIAVGRATSTGAAFFPPELEATSGDVRFVGILTMISILAYAFGFLGSLALVNFSLYDMQASQPKGHPGSYYKGRLSFYSFWLLAAGMSQLLIGSYIASKFGNIRDTPVQAAIYIIHFPSLSVVAGSLQVLNALFGYMRAYNIVELESDNLSFQMTTLITTICHAILGVFVQISYASGDTAAAMAPTVIAFTLGTNLFPAYLEHKMRTVPENLPEDYYCLHMTPNDDSSTDNQDPGV